MKQKHIVVVDGAWAGHHPSYVKAFVRILFEAGYKVSVFCPAPEEIKLWLLRSHPFERDRFDAYYFSDRDVRFPKFLPARIKALLTCLGRWVRISNAMKEICSSTDKPDMIFFAWLDSYLNRYMPARLIDKWFPYPWSGLYFHPRHYRNKSGNLLAEKYVPPSESLVANSRMACSLAVLDEGVIHKLRAYLCEKEVFVFPDFSDEIPPEINYYVIEEIKTKANGRKIIGLIGSLERRKGLLTLLRVARQPASQGWLFVVAGEFAAQSFSKQELNEIKLFFDEPRDNIFAHFGKISDDAQFNALLKLCDVIFAVYEDFPHSSNLVTKAAKYGKTILVSTGGYMEEVVRKYELGEAVPAGDIQAALAFLGRINEAGVVLLHSAGMRAYSLEQSQDKLRKALLGLVEQCIAKTDRGIFPII